MRRGSDRTHERPLAFAANDDYAFGVPGVARCPSLECRSRRDVGGGAVLTFDLGVVESAGVGAHINFVRLDMYAATGEFIERQEIGANQIGSALGSNYIRGGGSVRARVTFPFRSTIKAGRTFDVIVDFTDDRGNHLVSRTSFVWTKG